MPSQLQVQHVAHTNVDDSKETLIALLELALVEDLDGNNRGILHVSAWQLKQLREAKQRAPRTYMSKLSFQ